MNKSHFHIYFVKIKNLWQWGRELLNFYTCYWSWHINKYLNEYLRNLIDVFCITWSKSHSTLGVIWASKLRWILLGVLKMSISNEVLKSALISVSYDDISDTSVGVGAEFKESRFLLLIQPHIQCQKQVRTPLSGWYTFKCIESVCASLCSAAAVLILSVRLQWCF